MKLSKVKDVVTNDATKIKDVAIRDARKVKSLRRFVPNAVSTRTARGSLVVQKHSPAILFGVGIVGFAGTVVLACRATLKLDEVLEETTLKTAMANEARDHNPNYSDADHRQDIAYLRIRSGYAIVKLYAPAIALGSLSVAALTGSHHILSKRNAGLTAAYAATEKAFAEYRERVREEIGEEKEKELRHGVEERTVVEDTEQGPKKRKLRGFKDASQYAVVFDPQNKNWENTPEYNIMFLRTVQNYLNDELNARGHVLLNDAYEALGFERTSAGAVVGWVKYNPKTDNDGFIDFGVFSDEMRDRIYDYVTGKEGAILIDFNVDGVVWDLISKPKKDGK